MRKPLIAGNWKMNLNHLEAIAVTQKLSYSLDDKDFDAADIAIFPPFTDIRSVQTLIDGDRLRLTFGGQDLSPENSGAFTGEISGYMLSKLGCTFVLVGHSERRTIQGETSALVARKAKAALANAITPIICIGEDLTVRDSGKQVEYVVGQLADSISGLATADLKKVVFAYEPVWAIGTGKTATPSDAQEVCAAIREAIHGLAGAEISGSTRVLYGGSVKSANIVEIMRENDIDGVLVGGASLDSDEFARIAKFHRVAPPN